VLLTVCDEDYRRAVDKKLCKRVERIHSIGVNKEKFSPVDTDEKNALRERYGFDKEDVLCLCVGDLNENKNQKLLISALPEVKKDCPAFKLLLAGSGPNDSELRALTKEKGLDDSVVFLGQRTDIPDLVREADFTSSASFREGLPIAVMEGMACKKPAAMSRNRGHCELGRDGENSLLFDPYDAEDAARALRFLALNKEERLEMGERAFETTDGYSSDLVCEELRRIYTSLFEGGGQSE
jgi:glycosyltransferase EpsD